MKRLLIVDDISQNLYLLEVLLKTNGFDVETASNGKEALEKARAKQPDMIISDILMPGMDGFSLCRVWKSDKDLKEIPLIFYTATYTDEKDRVFALGLGADRFLVKPMEPDDLLKEIEEVFLEKEKGNILVPKNVKEEESYIREYNEVLIRKLEDKMAQLQLSNKRLFTLFHTSNILGKMKPADEAIHDVLVALVEKAGYQQAFYFSYAERTKTLSMKDAITGNNNKPAFTTLGLINAGDENGLIGYVAKTKELVNVIDTAKEPRWLNMGDEVKSALIIPVQYEDHFLGVLSIYSNEIEAFTEVDEQILSTLANNLAIAIENRGSKEKVENHFQRLNLLHKIDIAILNSTDLMVTLNLLISQVIAQLVIDAVDILLYNWKTQTYKIVVGNGFLTNVGKNTQYEHVLAKMAIQKRKIVHIATIDQLPPSYPFRKYWDYEGFKQYWGIPIMAKGVIIGVMEIYNRSIITPDQEWIDFLETLAGQAAIAIENAEIHEGLLRSNYELTLAYDATIEGWSKAMDMRDRETEGHTQRVTAITIELTHMFDMSEEEMLHIRRGALLHDMGKLGVPDRILHKPGPLNEEEWELMRKHPVFAFEMLAPINYLKNSIEIPYCHHEKMDGSGYPRGLKGEEIPLSARIFAVADVYDALTSDRPYRAAWSKEKALAYIRDENGRHFDPQVVEKFFKLIENKPEILDK